MGLVRWGALGSATLGLATNGLGVATAVGLALIPEPTLLTKAAAGVVGTKSIYGLGANGVNFYDALFDKNPASKGALANDIAQLVAPGNETIQKAATIVDLTTDLATGRISANAAESLAGTLVKDANGFPVYEMEYLYVADPAAVGGSFAKMFNAAALTEVSYNDVYKAFYNDYMQRKNCP